MDATYITKGNTTVKVLITTEDIIKILSERGLEVGEDAEIYFTDKFGKKRYIKEGSESNQDIVVEFKGEKTENVEHIELKAD